jgi:hypothetical protein
MAEMLSVAVIYLLALIGLAFIVIVILGIYIAYHYDISFRISKTEDKKIRKPGKGGSDASAQATSEASHSKARQ